MSKTYYTDEYFDAFFEDDYMSPIEEVEAWLNGEIDDPPSWEDEAAAYLEDIDPC